MKPSPIIHKAPRTGVAGKSPTERTLALLKDLGLTSGIVERRLPHRRNLSLDLFHIIDIIALTPFGVMGVQSTGQDFAGHRRKLTEERALESARWLRTPGTSLMLIGWRKLKSKPGRPTWTPRIEMIQMDDLMPTLGRRNREDLASPANASAEELTDLIGALHELEWK